MMEGNDFFEGVKSVLVDRSHVPQWQHAKIEDVTNDEVTLLHICSAIFERVEPTSNNTLILTHTHTPIALSAGLYSSEYLASHASIDSSMDEMKRTIQLWSQRPSTAFFLLFCVFTSNFEQTQLS